LPFEPELETVVVAVVAVQLVSLAVVVPELGLEVVV